MEADERIIEALKVELKIMTEDGYFENTDWGPYAWANGVVSALCIMGIELSPAWIIEALEELE
tara:strand:- start:289 stop:477 length:189 start_codon:yes stop_codon:yes gene_type:complete